jgi:hypothetical protein
MAADNLTGVVTNGTTHKPSAGDDVVLIRLQQGMQESTRTKTDAHGRFTLEVPDEGIHLVRVTHDKANYFRPAPPGTQSVEIEVFNSAAKVAGVANEADVMRIQTDAGGAALHVVENFFVKNDSNPKMTQFSDKPFEFWLPDGAVVEGSAALAPGGMPVQAAPVPLADKGHYTFLFPIRPGETRFQISYRLPYSGKFNFTPRMGSTTDTIAVMMPKAMTFTAAPGSPFNPVTEEESAQTYVARNVSPTDSVGFTISGSGQLPRDAANPAEAGQSPTPSAADSNAQSQVDANGNPDPTKFGGGMGKPLDPEGNRDPLSRYKWWILGGLALLLAGGAGVLLRKPSTAGTDWAAAGVTPASAPAPEDREAQVMQTLKEELFALETDRLQGRVSDAEYAETKAALELILKRSLRRAEKPISTTAPAPEDTLAR